MKLYPWEDTSKSDTEEIRSICRNQNIYYRIHTRQLLVLILIEMDPVHTLPSYCCKIRFNIIVSPTFGSP
jgi:hypothetical protein